MSLTNDLKRVAATVTTGQSSPRHLGDMARAALAATRGRWARCTANEGNCACRTIWSVPLDVPAFCLAPTEPNETVRIEDWNFVATFDPPTALTLIAIAQAALAVRNARRDGLPNDAAHEELARALDAAELSGHETTAANAPTQR